jgi:tRNA-2-methylthio-N6-dimethylallyladenosine synthase
MNNRGKYKGKINKKAITTENIEAYEASKLTHRLYHIETWGCQMNEEDSQKLAGMLKNLGYTEANNRDEANLIIFNTCAVRENPEHKVYGNLGLLKAMKKQKPDLIIAVGGCMMQQAGMAEKIKKSYPFVDIIFGTFNIHRFPELLNNVIQSSTGIVEIWEKEGEIIEDIPIKHTSEVKAYVTIMYGCNNFCTYCIVPYTRGRERSRTPQSIIDEIINLANKGYKEITLLGQNVNSYGKDLEDMSFGKLLRSINDIEKIERVRFMTSHPKDLNDEVIHAIRDCRKLCEHIHLPVQSGSSRILKAMNRRYTKEQYLELVEKIKMNIPGVALTTDLIVGFPGETEEDFLETLDIVSKVEFESIYTFIYSLRKGTPAAELGEQIPEEVKGERFRRLLELVNKIGEKKTREYMDKTVEVLVEETSKLDEYLLSGRTRTGKLVYFSGGDISLKGKIVKVKVIKTQMYTLVGELVEIVR